MVGAGIAENRDLEAVPDMMEGTMTSPTATPGAAAVVPVRQPTARARGCAIARGVSLVPVASGGVEVVHGSLHQRIPAARCRLRT